MQQGIAGRDQRFAAKDTSWSRASWSQGRQQPGKDLARRQPAPQQGFFPRQHGLWQAQIAQGGQLACDEFFTAAALGIGHE
jgi:hypothetical protein